MAVSMLAVDAWLVEMTAELTKLVTENLDSRVTIVILRGDTAPRTGRPTSRSARRIEEKRMRSRRRCKQQGVAGNARAAGPCAAKPQCNLTPWKGGLQKNSTLKNEDRNNQNNENVDNENKDMKEDENERRMGDMNHNKETDMRDMSLNCKVIDFDRQGVSLNLRRGRYTGNH